MQAALIRHNSCPGLTRVRFMPTSLGPWTTGSMQQATGPAPKLLVSGPGLQAAQASLHLPPRYMPGTPMSGQGPVVPWAYQAYTERVSSETHDLLQTPLLATQNNWAPRTTGATPRQRCLPCSALARVRQARPFGGFAAAAPTGHPWPHQALNDNTHAWSNHGAS
jgi:hypothetical protein